jgi:hypothetical protein
MQPGIFGLGMSFDGAIVIITVAPFVLLSLAIPYAVLRLRGEIPPDPQLGFKIGLQFFFSVAIIIALAGVTIMAVDLMTRDNLAGRVPGNEGFNEAQRTGLGMALSGLLLALIHFLLGQLITNQGQWPRVRRTFAGWRFAIQGVVVMFALTALLIQFFQKDALEPQNVGPLKRYVAILGIWGPAWVIHLVLLSLSGQEAPPSERYSRSIRLDDDD